MNDQLVALMHCTHSGLFASSPGVKACSGPTTENDELSEAGARVLVVSVTVSFSPGAYINMNSLTFKKSLCFGICDSIDYDSKSASEVQGGNDLRRGPYSMFVIPILIQV